MTRRLARISQDEVARMVRAVRSCGLPIGQVIFDGEKVSLVIGGESGETSAARIDEAANDEGLIREPQP